MKRHTARRSVQRYAVTAIVVTVVLILFAGCGKAKPTATPVPTDVPPTLGQAQDKTATQTPTPVPSPTPIPPTATATQTPMPPTATATQTPIPPTPTRAASATPTQTPAPEIPIETVSLVAEDGVKLAGNLIGGEGKVAVILTHMMGSNRVSWLSFAKLITTKGFTALIFDFRGYGASEGKFSYSQPPKDVLTAIEFLHERGYERIICMGASIGGTACVEAALLGADFEGLGVISGEINLTAEQAATLTMPKFLATEEDAPQSAIDQMASAHKLLPEPKAFEIIPSSAHGTDLLKSSVGDEFRQMLLDFLQGL